MPNRPSLVAQVREWAGRLRHGRRDADLEAELRTHLEMAADEQVPNARR